MSIVVVDLGTGNLRSVAKAVEHVAPGREVIISHLPQIIEGAERVVLPGQGAIGTWMNQLESESHLGATLKHAINTKPVLGICVGMQALFEHSEEDGGTTSLAVIKGQVKRFPDDMHDHHVALKIPQMGWNIVHQKIDHPCWSGIKDQSRFYFANSYYPLADNPADIAGECVYGLPFCAAVARGNLFAVQFHPEKSQHAGLKLIENFINWSI